MGDSYFKGWVSTLPKTDTGTTAGSQMQVFVGHVLEVFYDENGANPLSGERSTQPGEIRVKIMGLDRKKDDDVTMRALPADVNLLKYPIPGELVFLLQAMEPYSAQSPDSGGGDSDRFMVRYYYISTITANSSATFNSNPFYTTSESDRTVLQVVTEDYKTRFERKIKNLASFKNELGDKTIRERRSLQPFEGDFIIQSRFGSSIRFGSTGLNEVDSFGQYNNPWSKSGGVSGNPITIISADRKIQTGQIIEDVNKDDSSIYVCTTQIVPVILSTSKDLKSYRFVYNTATGDTITASPDRTAFAESADDELQYQQEYIAPNLSNIPLVVTGNIKEILDAIPESLLDPVQGLRNNRNQVGEFVWIDVGKVCLEKNTAKALVALLRAALEGGTPLSITSGYRPQFGPNTTVTSKKGVGIRLTTQETLRRDSSRWVASVRSKYANDQDFIFNAPASGFNPATAAPGRSNHGNGTAVDFGVGSRVARSFGALKSSQYIWLIRNAHKFGFVRTVSTEEWHFEFRPDLAANGPYGGIAAARKDPATRSKFLFYKDLQLDNLT